MNRPRTAEWLCAGVLALALPLPGAAQQRVGQATAELAPDELRSAFQASRAVFAAQAAERKEAETAGLADLEQDLRALHDAIASAAENGRAMRAAPATPERARAEASPEASQKIAEARQKLDAVDARRSAIDAKIAGLRSPRQRAVARGALAQLGALGQETRAALAATDDEREKRLTDLAARLDVIRIQGARRDEPHSPPPTITGAPPRPGPKQKGTRRYGQGG